MNNERSANSILSLALCAKSPTKMLKLTNGYSLSLYSVFCLIQSYSYYIYLILFIYLYTWIGIESSPTLLFEEVVRCNYCLCTK